MFFLFMDLIDDESDLSKFEEVYLNTRALSYKICYSVLKDHGLSEDAVSETYYRLARCFSKLNKEDDDKILSYIKLASKHSAFAIYNKRKKCDEDFSELEDITTERTVEELVLSEHSAKDIYENIFLKLPETHYDILYMSAILGLSLKQISISLGVPMSTVYKRYERAKDYFKKQLKKYMEEE